MKAAVVQRFGPIGDVAITAFPEPMAGAGEVVVALSASDVNYPDILYVEGRYQRAPELPFVPGLAGAGRIVEIGEGVTGRALGERVLALPDSGTYAERVRAPTDWCLPIPDDMPFEVAAAFGLAYQTAWFALCERGGFTAGNTVLVLGARGGVSMAAIQLARALGAGAVIAVTRGDEGAAFARAIGADATIDATADDLRSRLVAEVKMTTGGHGVDIVIDPVGGATSAAAVRALGWSGRHVVVGFAAGDIPSFPANYLLVKNIAVLGLQWTDYRARRIDLVREAQARIGALWAQGKLSPVIGHVLPLDRFGEALETLAGGRARGKIILAIGSGDLA